MKRCAPLRSVLVPVLAVACTVFGCSTNRPLYSPPTVTPETVFVVPGAMSDAFRYGGSTDFGSLFAEYLAGALQARGISAVSVPRGEDSATSAHSIVTCDLIEVDPGSWNLRFWIGFGAGRALIRARATLREASQESLVYDHEYRARSLTWQSQERILRRTLSKIARSAAADLSTHLRPSR
jgi:hypothetical protein